MREVITYKVPAQRAIEKHGPYKVRPKLSLRDELAERAWRDAGGYSNLWMFPRNSDPQSLRRAYAKADEQIELMRAHGWRAPTEDK